MPGVWPYVGISPFSEALRNVFDEVVVERMTCHEDLIDDEITDRLFFAR